MWFNQLIRNTRVDNVPGISTLEQGWARLGADGGSLHAASSDQLTRYLQAYNRIKEVWWSTMLKRSVARSSLARYMGKQRVMDRFWAKVLTESSQVLRRMQLLTGVERVRLAVFYGTAVKTLHNLPVHGHRAVPSQAMLHRCAARFGNDVYLEWEHFTSKRCIDTMTELQPVCARHTLPPGSTTPVRQLEAVKQKRGMPAVRAADKETHLTAMAREAAKASSRNRAGIRPLQPLTPAQRGQQAPQPPEQQQQQGGRRQQLRCKEVRGLRFNRVKGHLQLRDGQAAVAICRLGLDGLAGEPRLAFFTRRMPST